MAREEVCYRVLTGPDRILDPWSRLNVMEDLPCHERRVRDESTSLDPLWPAYIPADRLKRLRDLFAIPGTSKRKLAEELKLVRKEDEERDQYQTLQRQRKRGKKLKLDESISRPRPDNSKIAEFSHRSNDQIFSQGSSEPYVAPLLFERTNHQTTEAFNAPDSEDRLDTIEIHTSVSSKLNWILHEVNNTTQDRF